MERFETPEEQERKNGDLAQQAAIGDKIRQLEPDQLGNVLDHVEQWIKENGDQLRDPEVRARAEKIRGELERLLEITKPH